MEEVTIDYVTYISAPPDRVWQALIRPEYTKLYFFGRAVESDWRIGSPFVLRMEDGRIDSKGRVVRCDPQRVLEVTWHVEWLEEFRHLPEVNVRFTIEPLGDVVRLTVSQMHLKPVDEKLVEAGHYGWPLVICGLKTLLETGHPMPVIELPPAEAIPGTASQVHTGRGHFVYGG